MGTGNSGFSEAGLRRLREVLTRHVDSKKIPGLVALVSRGGQTHVEAIGTMRHDGGAPMSRDTIFRMASTSKPVSIAAAMVLLDECRLRLDDPVEPWLPELADRRVLKRIDGPLDDALLVVSELAANALTHARSSYRIRLSATPMALRIEVDDAGAGTPEPQPLTDTEEHGRGLHLVDALAASWGMESAETGGKRVWAELALPAAAAAE